MNKRIHISKRTELPWYKAWTIRGAAILLALITCAVVTMLLTGENPILYTLYPGGEGGRGRLPLALPPALGDQAEPNCDREQLAAALYAQGAVTLESLLGEIPC